MRALAMLMAARLAGPLRACVWLLLVTTAARPGACYPSFMNGNFQMATGEPFMLQWTGNSGSVTIDLYTAPESARKLVMNVASKLGREGRRPGAWLGLMSDLSCSEHYRLFHLLDTAGQHSLRNIFVHD
jgi:hypothetical protein